MTVYNTAVLVFSFLLQILLLFLIKKKSNQAFVIVVFLKKKKNLKKKQINIVLFSFCVRERARQRVGEVGEGM